LLAAVDDWAATTSDGERRAWLLAIARATDPDPAGWRDQFRQPAAWESKATLTFLAGQAREQLVRGTDLGKSSPQLLGALGLRLRARGGAPVPLLLAAQARYPGDFWLNYELAYALQASRPQEAVGFYRAALAVRPDAGTAYNNLGVALSDLGRHDDAVAC